MAQFLILFYKENQKWIFLNPFLPQTDHKRNDHETLQNLSENELPYIAQIYL